jgi:hypothetical protein
MSLRVPREVARAGERLEEGAVSRDRVPASSALRADGHLAGRVEHRPERALCGRHGGDQLHGLPHVSS